MDEIESAVEVDMGDLVVCNDWVGQVCTNASHSVLSMIEFPIPSLLGYRGPFIGIPTSDYTR